MIPKIAWKNIWRSRSRSLIVIGSVVAGVWAFIYMMAFVRSMSDGYINNAVRFQTSHLQIHNPKFVDDKDVKYILQPTILKQVEQLPEVKASSIRSLATGMIRSSRATRGITIKGIDPQKEIAISPIDKNIVEGTYLSEEKNHEILISQALAKKLKVKLRKKIVLYFQDINGEVVTGSFRIKGFFKTSNKQYDEANVYIKRRELNTYLGNPEAAHEISVLLKHKEDIPLVQKELSIEFPDLLVQNYTEIAPDINLFESQMYVVSIIMLFIFMLALVFGIVNTMLMAILERTHELGMLMAIGMARIKLFWMIVLETLFLSVIGAPVGMLLGWLTVSWSKSKGIDLSSFSKGAEQFGLDTVIYPQLEFNIIVQLTIAVFLTAIVAAIYPAIKAVRLQPLEAIRNN